jgi:hypothetical protein
MATEKQHDWAPGGRDKIGNAIERCAACGIRKIENCSTFWQRAPGARWVDAEDVDMPECGSTTGAAHE